MNNKDFVVNLMFFEIDTGVSFYVEDIVVVADVERGVDHFKKMSTSFALAMDVNGCHIPGAGRSFKEMQVVKVKNS